VARLFKFAFALAFLAGVGGAAWLYHYAHRPLPLPQSPFAFSLAPGSSIKAVGKKLAREGLLQEPWSFLALARLQGVANQVKAGDYELAESLTPLQLLDELVKGQRVSVAVQFIEGHSFAQLRQVLDSHPELLHDTKGLSDAEVLKLAGAEETQPEGLFFPDTYHVGRGASDTAVLKIAYQAMKERLSKEWEARSADAQYGSPYEALIMASIVEKETGAPAERPLIAAVFLNRLKKNMRLQTDPTVIYGMGASFDGNLRKRDLQTDTPYNTYTRAGLPPTPITMPGLASIQAALNPATSEALYFVSRGDGTHEFSANLTDHNRAVARFQK
jgi:UPF0755 protein